MKLDFVGSFQKFFKSDDDIKLYRRRLVKKLSGLSISSIIDGYENLVELDHSAIPSVLQIVNSAKQVEKQRLRQQREAASISKAEALPKPASTRDVDVLELLRQAVKNPDASRSFKQKVAEHNALLEAHYRQRKITGVYADTEHQCCFGACSEPGSLSQSLHGQSKWYCSKHKLDSI